MGNVTSQQKYRLLDKLNLCHRCEKQPPAPNRKFCFDCLGKIAAYNAVRYNKEQAKQYQARRRELYNEKKSRGQCVRCSKLATHGIYCYECAIKVKHHNAETAQKRKRQRHARGLIPDMRLEHGLCLRCGTPSAGAAYCPKCMRSIGDALDKARKKSPFREMERMRMEKKRRKS